MLELAERECPELFETLRAETGGDPGADLQSSTAAAQPALVCASLAYWRALGRPRARFLAGHSLGELTALAVAGWLREDDAVRLAARRGSLMQAACDENAGCGMLAVRATPEAVEPIAATCGVWLANHNAPTQVVLSGSADRLEAARARLDAVGLKATRLRVAGAFHSPLMEPAVEPFRELLRGVALGTPRAVVYSSTSARPMTDPLRELPAALVARVRWAETVDALVGAGVRRFVEVGPGTVLSRLIEQTVDAPVLEPV
jgi:malonyl CoA-acyl carrier protein transacylase